MGIYDREYYRNEGPSYLDSIFPEGQVCKWLIGINIALFIAQLVTLPQMQPPEMVGAELRLRTGPVTELLELDPQQVAAGQVWRLLTYAFVHSPFGWTHIF